MSTRTPSAAASQPANFTLTDSVSRSSASTWMSWRHCSPRFRPLGVMQVETGWADPEPWQRTGPVRTDSIPCGSDDNTVRDRPSKAMIAAVVNRYIDTHGLQRGTYPENRAAHILHRAGHKFVQQHRVGRYHLDFAWPQNKVGLEVDGPHHLRPDVAVKDVFRDCELQDAGWLIFRVRYTDSFEEHLARVSGLIHGELRFRGVRHAA